jgi:uncharacterized protein YndB with AHSA1/START domain
MSSEVTTNVSLLVRRPTKDVFEAVVDPGKIAQYWISRSSGPLEPHATVHWEFKVPGAEVDTTVTRFERNRALEFVWSDGTRVSWRFEEHESGGTVVDIAIAGFSGEQGEVVEAALDATQGFTIVLCDLKTYLESGVSARLCHDKAVLIAAGQEVEGTA